MTVAATGTDQPQERIPYPRKRPQNNWKGRKQGRLTFGKPAYFVPNKSGKGGYWYYNSTCECNPGKGVIIAARKTTESCGCLRVEACRKAKEGKDRRMEAEKIEGERRLKFDSSICRRHLPCDNIHKRGEELPPACFGDRCYVNAHLAIGI